MTAHAVGSSASSRTTRLAVRCDRAPDGHATRTRPVRCGDAPRGPVMTPPNIIYLHSHDTGRYVEPYGYAVPTPRIQKLADEGLTFRNAFCAASTCSASRACLLTGQ